MNHTVHVVHKRLIFNMRDIVANDREIFLIALDENGDYKAVNPSNISSPEFVVEYKGRKHDWSSLKSLIGRLEAAGFRVETEGGKLPEEQCEELKLTVWEMTE